STWRNVGVTPLYEPFDVKFQLRSGANVAWEGTSSLNLEQFLPYDAACHPSGTGTEVVNDAFALNGVAPGTYDVVLIVADPAGYRAPLKLAIQTAPNADGSYPLGQLVVGAAGYTDTVDDFED